MSETSFTATMPAADAVELTSEVKAPQQPSRTLFRVLAAISFCHLLNDMVQSLEP
jgi:FSR family fosmidomycin resistance protein-like MFS transporter